MCVCLVTRFGGKDIYASLVGCVRKLFKMKLGVCMYAHVYVCVCGACNFCRQLAAWPVPCRKMYGERLGDGVEYHLMKPTPRR